MEKKENLCEKPIVFKVHEDVLEYIEEVMIERREFNRSNIHREIFNLGLEEFKKHNKVKKKK